MKKAAVIGSPISHSLSPRIHGFWLEQYGIEGSYDAVEVKPEHLQSFLRALPEQGYAGVNITLPHKEEAMRYVDEIEPLSRLLGAVNTVVVKDGKLLASNTDLGGFFENIHQHAPLFPMHGGKAVVIGAGGAARAIVMGLLIYGVPQVVIVNRTEERAGAIKQSIAAAASDGRLSRIDWEKLAEKIVIKPWAERESVLVDANLLVNTTSLGMKNQPPLELSLKNLPITAMVTDIVYNPLETELLKAARTRGNTVVDGLGMLLHQAVPGFEAWFGVKPEVTEKLRIHVLNGYI
ncbi:MAG: shikimate dehydrogenase [Proteobacteria bacterium]|nr:shikimate dehydrogenase [Pseudomonadota bacterium]